jgi:hypothetical protein
VQRFEEEAFGGLGIPRRAQEKLERIPLGIHCSVEIHPDFLHFNVRLIHFPGVVAGFQTRSASFVELWAIVLDSTIDRGMIDRESALGHHFLKISITERIAQVPTNAQQNDLGFEMTPFKWSLVLHQGNSSAVGIEQSLLEHRHLCNTALRRASLTYGVPQVLTLDHGTVFYDNTTPSPFPTTLHLWLLALGVQVRFTRKRCPTDHAIIERTHQTMTAQALLGQTYTSPADLWAGLDERREVLN